MTRDPYTILCTVCEPSRRLSTGSWSRHIRTAKHLRAKAERERGIAETREADTKKKRRADAERAEEAALAAERRAEEEQS